VTGAASNKGLLVILTSQMRLLVANYYVPCLLPFNFLGVAESVKCISTVYSTVISHFVCMRAGNRRKEAAGRNKWWRKQRYAIANRSVNRHRTCLWHQIQQPRGIRSSPRTWSDGWGYWWWYCDGQHCCSSSLST